MFEGKEKELYLCSKCAGEENNSAKLKFFTSQPKSNLSCICNTKFDEILQSGYVGCPKCYDFFKKELEPIITALHTKPYHTGKKKLSKLQIYTVQLEKAIKSGFVSLAEKLRTQIANLKEEDK
jgi:protein arginine kinase activator